MSFLEYSGHTLLLHNYHTRWCEVDLITLAPNLVIHAVEVKSWKNTGSWLLRHPLSTFSKKKIHLLRNALKSFIEEFSDDHTIWKELLQKNLSPKSIPLLYDLSISFDLIWIQKKGDIEYFQNLF